MKIILDPWENDLLNLFSGRVKVAENGKSVITTHSCGCETNHTISPAGGRAGHRGGTFSESPSRKRFLVKLITNNCFKCRNNLELIKKIQK